VIPPAELAREVEAAREASVRLARRPRRQVAAALAAAAARWRDDASLHAELPKLARLSPPVVAAGLAIAAEALDADVMAALVERELAGGPPARPWLVAHVLASNVPALALPAIALGCLAGAAVLVKSGRADPCSAPAFRRALAAEDPELAETVVTTYWPGGDEERERVALGRAEMVVATGHDTTVATLVRRLGDRVIAHGERSSIVAIGRDTSADADALAGRIAMDVALHDQRGCLSPHAVYVDGDRRAFADRLAEALDALAVSLPPGPLEVEERAAHRAAVAEAEWAGATVRAGVGGTVLVAGDRTPLAAPGRRTVWIRPLGSLRDMIPPHAVECVGVAGLQLDVETLRKLGVARVCAPGRMQRPRLSWPRGQRAPLRTLLGLPGAPELEIEAT
jgi:acyl-CoA reductase-like NAD-dependent aldehyde dehydrogenase